MEMNSRGLALPESEPEDRYQRLSDHDLLEELRRRIERNTQAMEELKKVNAELIRVNKKLEESEALKSHFMSNITNEIINPFTSILGLSRAILTVDKEAWKKVISMVALIHTEAFSLDFQFRNIFYAARLEAGQEHPEVLSVDVRSVVATVVDSFRFELRKKRLKVSVDDQLPAEAGTPYYFKTDPAYLKVLLANLLNNAVNFSLEGDDIDVTLGLSANDMLSIAVRDYGVGISEDRLNEIFDRFSRGDTKINSVNRGHGLGLSVSRALVDLLGGSITAESKLGEGSVFHLQVPQSEKVAEGIAIEPNEIFFDDTEETF